MSLTEKTMGLISIWLRLMLAINAMNLSFGVMMEFHCQVLLVLYKQGEDMSSFPQNMVAFSLIFITVEAG